MLGKFIKMLRAANSIVIGHNHPSGEVKPSEEDIRVTDQIKNAGDIIGIKLLDHVIVGKDGYYSFQENNDGDGDQCYNNLFSRYGGSRPGPLWIEDGRRDR